MEITSWQIDVSALKLKEESLSDIIKEQAKKNFNSCDVLILNYDLEKPPKDNKNYFNKEGQDSAFIDDVKTKKQIRTIEIEQQKFKTNRKKIKIQDDNTCSQQREIDYGNSKRIKLNDQKTQKKPRRKIMLELNKDQLVESIQQSLIQLKDFKSYVYSEKELLEIKQFQEKIKGIEEEMLKYKSALLAISEDLVTANFEHFVRFQEEEKEQADQIGIKQMITDTKQKDELSLLEQLQHKLLKSYGINLSNY